MLGKPLLSRRPLAHGCCVDDDLAVHHHHGTKVEVEKIGRRTPFDETHRNQISVGPIVIRETLYSAGMRVRADEPQDNFAVLIPISACGEAVHARERVPLVKGRAAFLGSPQHGGVTLQLEPDNHLIEVVIPRPLVTAAFTALTSSTGSKPLWFEPRISTTSGAGAAMLRLLRFLVDEVDRDEGLLASPLIATRLAEDLVYVLLQGQPHNHADLLRPSPRAAEPRCVRVVAEYLDAHAAEPVSLADLVAVSGVSVRALQAGFRRHRDCSPMEFLRERRLALARTRLLASPGSMVKQIALECGFEHLGRFSAQYRARFGETPAETLRRAHGRAFLG